MSIKAEYYGRVLREDKTIRQWLKFHILEVAEKAQRFAEESQPICPDDNEEVRKWKESFHRTAWYVGALHDLGKYRKEFQEYLLGQRSRSTETNHAVYGSAAAWHHLVDAACSFSIAGHHAGLHDLGKLDLLVNGEKYEAHQEYIPLLDLAKDSGELGFFPEFAPIQLDESDDNGKRCYEFMTRILFSSLVDADRLDAEQWEMEQKLGNPWNRPTVELRSATLLEKILTARDREAEDHPKDELNRLRNEIFDACIAKGASLPQGFFTLTVPTGGGKTLSSMSFALSHAKKHNLRRVIVVIPYLSIIEQNAKKYRDILGAEYILEHHSAVEIPETHRRDDSNDPNDPNEPNEPANTLEADKAMENWDMPIIVTTSVQFIETLFAASPGKARKLHNIPRSIVIFDEVQTLPPHLLDPTLNILRELKERWGVSFLFCSATQPAFRKSANLKQGLSPDETTEVAPPPETTFKKLRRVDYRIESKENPWDWRMLAERMISHPQALCILNVRRQAFELWQALQMRLHEKGCDKETEQGLFHLSSAMCPAHRLDLLGLSKTPPPNNIKERLTNGKCCWVASTQLIEAGVDIDFPIVFRAMGPLDSITQAAGRCNREGLLRDEQGNSRRGQVFVFYPQDAGLPPGIYNRGTNITPTYLLDPEKLAQNPEVFAQYFHELYQLTPMDFRMPGQRTIQEDRAEFRFRKVAEHAKVIKDETISVITPYGPAKEIVKKICRTKDFDYTSLRRLQRYMVNIRNQGPHSDFAKLTALDAIKPLLRERLEIPVLEEWCYKTDPPLGVVIENRPLEDFYQ